MRDACGSEADGELLKQWKSAAFELQVGIHELLGHGSGKLFYQDDAGGFNFDHSELKHPLHEGQGISTWCKRPPLPRCQIVTLLLRYKPGETWDGVFGSLSSAYEECRAECTGVFLCDDPLALTIFGHEGEEGHTITYIPQPPLAVVAPLSSVLTLSAPPLPLSLAATSTGSTWRAPACTLQLIAVCDMCTAALQCSV